MCNFASPENCDLEAWKLLEVSEFVCYIVKKDNYLQWKFTTLKKQQPKTATLSVFR